MTTYTTASALPNLELDDLADTIRKCADSDSHHILFVTSDGHVHVTDELREPSAWGHDGRVRFRYETYLRGNDYVGPKAADDARYVANLQKELVKDWSSGRTGFLDY